MQMTFLWALDVRGGNPLSSIDKVAYIVRLCARLFYLCQERDFFINNNQKDLSRAYSSTGVWELKI